MKRSFSAPRAAGCQPRRLHSFLPSLEKLEDRTTPTSGSWAMLADPEGDVFHDLNGNSIRDAGEPDVGPGWTVYVDSNENGAFDAGEIYDETDATGHYNILLPDGTYSIRVVPQGGFQDDRQPLGTLIRDYASIESGSGNNFSGLAWANGSLYVTFTRIEGVTSDNVMYQADPVTGAALGSAVSIPGDIGEIAFDGTDFWGADYVNDYLIRFNFAGTELQRLSFPGMDINSVEWDGVNLRVHDAAVHRIYEIDSSGSGTILGYVNTPQEFCVGLAFDGTHLWVNGTDTNTVYALNPTTGALEASFAHRGTFAYGMAVRGTNMWVSTHDSSRVFQYDLGYGGGRIVTVAGAPVAGVDLAVYQTASVTGRVFNDNNDNGLQDANDIGLAGWRVYLESGANGQFDPWERSVVTNAFGDYTFDGLRPGVNTIVLDLAGQRLDRWMPVAPHVVTLSSGETASGKNFANFLDRTTPIAANEWGTFQGGELSFQTGLAWYEYTGPLNAAPNFDLANTIVDTSTQGGYTDWRLPTKTEAQAAAAIGVGPRLELPTVSEFWTSTPSKAQRIWVVNLYSGFAATVNQISHRNLTQVRDTGIVIDDGAAGYSASGFSSKSTSGAYLGDQSTATASGGPKTATWTFSGLEPGATYKVDVTWKPVSGAATNAPFTIINGAATTPKSINQSVAPNDYLTGESTAWEGLGTYTLNGSTLSVQLNKASSGTVIADAVRIFKVLPSYAPPAPFMAAGGEAANPVVGPALTAKDVKPLLEEALRRWKQAGANVKALGKINIQIADLPSGMLGQASGNTITLDRNAAGHGWFVDRTPKSDSEFTLKGNQGEQGRIDLLTVLMHEVGHLLGHDHDDHGLMGEDLAAGGRWLPEVNSVRWNVDVR